MANDYEKGFNAGLDKASEIVLDLESRWRKSAMEIRQSNTWTRGLFTKKTFVAPHAETAAKNILAAAGGLESIREILSSIRAYGYAAELPESSSSSAEPQET